MSFLQVAMLPLAKLQPSKRNARTHSKRQIGQLANSIRRFGWTYPILTDEQCEIIAGFGRYKAAEHLGLKEVPVIVMTGLSEAEKRALALADNKIAAMPAGTVPFSPPNSASSRFCCRSATSASTSPALSPPRSTA